MKEHLSNSFNITHLEASVNYTIFHFKDGHREIHAYTLKKYETDFSSSKAFSRIHRRFLVNRQFIASHNESEVLLSCGKRLPLARRRRV
ncbi:LytTR family transcriptional regulator [Lacihabitans sp. CCS-44]|uniref:LytTR family DNA-binding domain-containing protein n=1 Tax=Lacihabitans sp. CCS-44 TaxID=2487331 RepID=UPI0020CF789B|nr:LytTR family DNA-binding domain-containing protein [Lacihabitans sp. CCS-44]MCP9755531.1 LytTR family transcriptional regulator [Lacihabitans sp. CCS-44]